jgi:hypothetical protein
MSGDTVIAGAIGFDLGPATNTGAAYVFQRMNGSWAQAARLTGSNAGPFWAFGASVAVHDNLACIGAPGYTTSRGESPGAAFVFSETSGVWTESAILFASIPTDGESFGDAVAVSQDRIVVGASLAFSPGAGGAVYVFDRVGNSWIQSARLIVAGSVNLGGRVALSGDTILASSFGVNQVGSARVLHRSGGSWQLQATLVASDGQVEDRFGHGLDIDGDTAVIGAYRADVSGQIDSGAAYVFQRVGSTWTQTAKLVASNGAPSDAFGFSASVSFPHVMLGASNDVTVPGFPSGSAYAFNMHQVCVGDTNGDSRVDIDDLVTVLAEWGTSAEGKSDTIPVCGNGSVDMDDVLALINSWGACP